MKNFSKILRNNMIIMLVYTIAIQLMIGKHGDRAEGILISMIFPVGAQVLVNFIISMVQFLGGNKELGKSYLLSTFLVLVIGFSACWGSAYSTTFLK